MRKIVITGAAGLVGQNLVARLKSRPDIELVGIDKHAANVALFRQVHPDVRIIEADLAEPGAWSDCFSGADTVVINQAQIGGLFGAEFEANNVTATRHILAAIERHAVPYFVGISSSVVNSAADDFYTRSKTAQERLFDASPVPHVTLRPTLMFGWFDRKHLGWLRRFMDRAPVFPIPGDGRFDRQPLYVGDFVSIIVAAIESRKAGTFDISGLEQISYGDLIALIHDIVKPRARIVHIPYALFWALLWLYARFDKNPPFTTGQLEALVLPETFPVIDWPTEFGVKPTALRQALTETFLDREHSQIVLAF
ncbi:NAD-dependent epimerase/dehydratase family protein [Rhodopseudomonas sp. HC1]|uniref:NAD-dependent epimerase/dehydratase family protein n=1 Tax=Rhodopseudomonas infernalis TaxID=2897386 RepID=UPI001EE79908|nr:NAD-dependent epimerase/dehydratase family protein [Rhodopseudomonas infernalis]MCG6205026.1 NAD-dependent epimerase/dehydratase family protein [Rhodopseudomonas infernalis]